MCRTGKKPRCENEQIYKINDKACADIFMTVLLLFLMGYQFWGETAHEWAGTLMLLLFIAHHILNAGWYKNIFRGRYTPIRIIMTVINLALLVAMLCLMGSGIMMSRHVFSFLSVSLWKVIPWNFRDIRSWSPENIL